MWQQDINFAKESAAPAERQMSVVSVALDSQGDILEQRTEQLLAITVACRGSEPDTLEIFTECKDLVAFFACKRVRSCVLAVRKLGLGGLQLYKSVFDLTDGIPWRR